MIHRANETQQSGEFTPEISGAALQVTFHILRVLQSFTFLPQVSDHHGKDFSDNKRGSIVLGFLYRFFSYGLRSLTVKQDSTTETIRWSKACSSAAGTCHACGQPGTSLSLALSLVNELPVCVGLFFFPCLFQSGGRSMWSALQHG